MILLEDDLTRDIFFFSYIGVFPLYPCDLRSMGIESSADTRIEFGRDNGNVSIRFEEEIKTGRSDGPSSNK